MCVYLLPRSFAETVLNVILGQKQSLSKVGVQCLTLGDPLI